MVIYSDYFVTDFAFIAVFALKDLIRIVLKLLILLNSYLIAFNVDPRVTFATFNCLVSFLYYFPADAT